MHDSLPVAERWFSVTDVGEGVTLLREDHVIDYLRCNCWLVHGRDRDLIVDSGLGLVGMRAAAHGLLDGDLVAVATHAHYDHVGSLHEFDVRLAHPEAAAVLRDAQSAPMLRDQLSASERAFVEGAGYVLPSAFVTAVPEHGFDLAAVTIRPTEVTDTLVEGDVIDLGDRSLHVLELPGHAPGCIALYEPATGTLFSGDAMYDGPLLVADADAYAATMRRLLALDITVVHGGHDPSFGRDRLRAIARDALTRWGS